MDQDTLKQQSIFNLELNMDSKFALQSIAKWCKFFAILGFVMTGFLVIASITIMFLGNTIFNSGFGGSGGIYSGLGSGMGFALGFFYLVFAAVYFIPFLWLYQFSAKCKQALISNDSNLLGTSLHHLRRHFKFMGILAIIFIALYVLIILFAIIGIGFAGLR